jgi:hypothetical protein
MEPLRWYGVRTVYEHIDLAGGDERLYEERVVLVRAHSDDGALSKAEAEAHLYGDEATRYLGLASAFEMFDEPGDNAEVYSLMRESQLEPEKYLDEFFDTGKEKSR